MTLLIRPEKVLELAFAAGEYFPPDTVRACDIAAAQQRAILPVTGALLLERLLDGVYPELTEEYVAPALAFAVRSMIQPCLDVRTGMGGTSAPRNDAVYPASSEQLARLAVSVRRRMQALLQRLSDRLNGSREAYPEYDPQQDVLRRVSLEGGILLER